MENPHLVAEAEHANSQTQRIIWVDLARAIAILSVITYHVGIIPFGWIFSAFQLPLFAFLSGYTTRWEFLTIPKLANKWLVWGSLYTASGIFSLALWYLITHLYNPIPSILVFPFEAQWNGLISGAGLPANGPLWFFLPFALATTLAAAVMTQKKKSGILLAGFLFILTDMPTKIFSLFLLLGAQWKKKNIQPKLNKWQFFITLFLFIFCAYINKSTDLHYGNLGNPLLFLISSLSGTLLTLHIAAWEKVPSFLSWIGRQSLPLFVLHWPAMLLVVFTFSKLSILAYFGAEPGLVSALIEKPKTFAEILLAILLWFLILANTLVLTLGMSEGIKKLYSIVSTRGASTH